MGLIMGFVGHSCTADSKSCTELCQVSAHPARVPSGQDEPTGGRVWVWDIHTAPAGTRRHHAKPGAGQAGAMPAAPKAWLPLQEPLPAGIFPGILPGTLGPCLQPATCHHCPQHALTRARARLPLLPPHPHSSSGPGAAVPRPPHGHPAVPRPPCGHPAVPQPPHHSHHTIATASQPWCGHPATWILAWVTPGTSMPIKSWQGTGMRLLLCTA